MIRINKKIFIERAKLICDINKFNFDFVEINCGTRSYVKIICLEHGEFYQLVSKFLRNGRCPECPKKNTLQRAELLERFFKIHGNRYNYEKLIYINRFEKSEIICNIHGSFWQTPDNHLKGKGCPYCAGNAKGNKEKFIKQAQQKFGDNSFYYDEVIYHNIDTPVIIKCPFHGSFKQTPYQHLKSRDGGCNKCVGTISIAEIMWLNSLNIPEKYRQSRLKIDNKSILVDAYDPLTNTVYEFNGDFWHGNPALYDQNAIHPKKKISFGELYQKTIEKENLIKENGYKFISIWESEWKKLKNILLDQ